MTEKFGSIARVISGLLCFTLILSLMGPVQVGAEGEGTGKVALAANVSATLFDAGLASTETGQIASFTIQIHNGSNSSVSLIDYWARIKGPNDKKYITKLSAEDMKKETIPANATGYLTFYAQVDKAIALSSLSIDLLKWDFSMQSYEKVLGQLKSSSNGLITYGQTKQALYEDKRIKFNLKQYTMYEDEQYSHVNVELSITNASSATINLDKLSYQAVTANHQIYSAQQGYQELSLKAYETKTVTIGTSIPKQNWNKQLTVQVLKASGEETVLNLPLANVRIANMVNTPALTIDASKVIRVNGQTIQLKSEESTVSQQDGKTYIKTKLNVESLDSIAAAMPGLQFYVKTFEGLLYPLQFETEGEITLLPKIKQSVTISGQIPNESILKTSQLVYFLIDPETKAKSFLGNYKIVLSNGDSDSETAVGSKEKTYNGLKIEQVTMQRTPNGLDDLIVAEFKVTNTTNTAKPVLNVQGKFVLDSVELAQAGTTIKSLDNTIVVPAGQSYRFIAFATIPYTQQVKTYGFSMSEIDSKESNKYIHTFSVDNIYSAKLLAENESYKIETIGKRGEVAFLNSSIYDSSTTKLLYAELLYTNGERRSNKITSLNGYVKNKKGDIVDIKFESYDQTILPADEIILTSWATLPRNFSTEGIEFYFGEGVQVTDEGATAVVNPVYTNNIKVTEEARNNFINIPIQQYQLTIRDIGAFLKSSDGYAADTIDLQFEYDLSLKEDAPNYNTNHTILIEFDDLTTPRIKFSKEFKLGEMQNGEDTLILGKGIQKSFEYSHTFVATKSFDVFQMNVYDVYQGHKRLIARRVLDMGSINR